jgi:RNA polymerase sigma factor (sigma-70 family)
MIAAARDASKMNVTSCPYRESTMPGSITRLIDLMRQGDENASDRFWDTYVPKLLKLARQKLSPQLAARVDAYDVVQDTMGSFFRRLDRGQFAFDSRDDIFRLLCFLLTRKAINIAVRNQHAMRDYRREITKTENERATQDPEHIAVDFREPRPEVAAAFTDLLERFIRLISDADLATVLRMKLDGLSTREIADAIGRTDRTVLRWLEKIQRIWIEHFESDDDRAI